ncbi:bifunctional metallophosphatase/5'-nucleotidase [Desulfovibrio sp. OttesenSCG-928-C14]|nr:bifunctional metallophosphatase/5'-nucleotidase [Desulfovibrio sp. OttesenSCG-928-C14]
MKYVATLKNHLSVLRIAILLAMLALVAACAQVQPPKAPLFPSADFALSVLHTNDTHSMFGGTTDKGFACYAAMCDGGRGGYVRLDQAVRAIRKDNPNALFLEAGDIFQGTLFWTLHKERVPSALVDKMGYQAIIPGNHEFDDGWPTWLRYVDALKTQVLAANVSFDPRPDSPAVDKVQPFTVIERDGRKIGVIGLVTETTPETSSPGSGVRFNDVQECLEDAVAKLTAQDVHIIIALVHLGLENEKRLARTVDGVDIFVGGHSHSLLSNTDSRAEGPYPVVEKTPNGTPVLLVTASTGCAYLGKLDVGFDKQGVVTEWQGSPIILDQATLDSMDAPKPDTELVQLINDFATPVAEMMATIVGTINAEGRDGLPLEEPNVLECRRVECLSGNVVADALRVVPFPEAQITILNGGALRASLPGGAVTPGNVLGTLPFQNTPVMAKMPGSILLQALEHGVSAYGEGEGGFFQVSGLRYAFNPSNKPGKRITNVDVMNQKGQWRALNPKETYMVVTLDFIAKGGDGYAMFKPLEWREGDKLMSDVLRVYMEQHSPVNASIQGRITVQK